MTPTIPYATACRGRTALVAALAGLVAVIAGCSRPQQASELPHTPIPKAEASLILVADGGTLRYQGAVADAVTRRRLTDALDGTGPAQGTIEVDPATQPPPWVAGLGPLAGALRRSGGQLQLQGKRIELIGELSQEHRATLLRQAQRLYPGYALAGQFMGVDLRQALPDQGDRDGLLAFLNAIPIQFHDNSGLLVPASIEGLARGARAIRATGPVGRLQLRVYPERDGEGAAVARQRAEAIATQLALRGIGANQVEAVVAEPADGGKAGIIEFTVAPSPPLEAAVDQPATNPEPAAEGEAEPAAPTPVD
jgi:hypothetical protein